MQIKARYPIAIAFLALFGYFYNANGIVATSVMYTAIQFALPLALAAMVGVMCERTGIVNIGIEGTMLLSAFTAFFVGAILKDTVLGLFVGVLTSSKYNLIRSIFIFFKWF